MRFSKWLHATLFLALPCLAQFDTADVVGTIRDASGGPVPSANVTLLNTETGISSAVKTAENGDYAFVNIKIGKYTVTAEDTFARTWGTC